MITLQSKAVEALNLPTGGGKTPPLAAAPDFPALLASVAVAPSAEGAVPAVADEPVPGNPVVFLVPTKTNSEMLVAPLALAQFSTTPIIIATPSGQKPASVASVVNEASRRASVDAAALGPRTEATETLCSIADLLALPYGNAVPVAVCIDQEVSIDPTAVVEGPVPLTLSVPKHIVESEMLVPTAAPFAVAASVLVEPVKRITSATTERTEVSVAPVTDIRSGALIALADKPAGPIPDRVATFAPVIADAVQDLVAFAHDKDVRFNVRPEMLGPVAVTIERTDAGPTLRLGVETQAAVQAVRQAEPTMNDARGSAPFVQITVDLNASDSRGRSPRTMQPQRAVETHISEQMQRQLPVSAGRYA